MVLDLYGRHEYVGAVIQAYMRRSLEDVVRAGVSVRLCKGIYDEPRKIAYKDYDTVVGELQAPTGGAVEGRLLRSPEPARCREHPAGDATHGAGCRAQYPGHPRCFCAHRVLVVPLL